MRIRFFVYATVLAVFTAYSLSVIVQHGYLGFLVLAWQEPWGMQMFVFNLRNPLFQDINVRKAMSQVWDFNWVNKNLFFNAVTMKSGTN